MNHSKCHGAWHVDDTTIRNDALIYTHLQSLYTIAPETEIFPVAQTQQLWQSAVAILLCIDIDYDCVKNVWHSLPPLITRWELGRCSARAMRHRCCLVVCSHGKRFSYRMPWKNEYISTNWICIYSRMAATTVAQLFPLASLADWHYWMQPQILVFWFIKFSFRISMF